MPKAITCQSKSGKKVGEGNAKRKVGKGLVAWGIRQVKHQKAKHSEVKERKAR